MTRFIIPAGLVELPDETVATQGATEGLALAGLLGGL